MNDKNGKEVYSKKLDEMCVYNRIRNSETKNIPCITKRRGAFNPNKEHLCRDDLIKKINEKYKSNPYGFSGYLKKLIFDSKNNLLRSVAKGLLCPNNYKKYEIPSFYIHAITDLIKSKLIKIKIKPEKSRPENTITIAFEDKIFESLQIEKILHECQPQFPFTKPTVIYKYSDTIRNKIFNYPLECRRFNPMFHKAHSIPCTCTSHPKYHYHHCKHVCTGNLNIIQDISPDKEIAKNLINILNKGPNYRLQPNILENPNKWFQKIQGSIDHSITSCIKQIKTRKKLKDTYDHNFNNWKEAVMEKITNNMRTEFPKISKTKDIQPELDLLKKLQEKYIFTYTDKCSSNVSMICKSFYFDKLKEELSDRKQFRFLMTSEYIRTFYFY